MALYQRTYGPRPSFQKHEVLLTLLHLSIGYGLIQIGVLLVLGYGENLKEKSLYPVHFQKAKYVKPGFIDGHTVMKEPGCLVHAHNWINTLAWVCLMLHFGAKSHPAELLVHPTESPTKHSYKGRWVSLSNPNLYNHYQTRAYGNFGCENELISYTPYQQSFFLPEFHYGGYCKLGLGVRVPNFGFLVRQIAFHLYQFDYFYPSESSY